MSTVRSLEVVTSRKLPMNYRYGMIQSVTGTLSAVGSVSASRSVHFERFDCSLCLVELNTILATYVCNVVGHMN